LSERRKSAKIQPGLGFIWRIPDGAIAISFEIWEPAMTGRILLWLLCFAMIAIAPARGYEAMNADFVACTKGKGTKKQIVQACTRLIDNAAKENEIVGYFYAFRAAANTDKKSNCKDAHKVIELIKDPKVIKGAKVLIKNNC
jgi:hypothetical protein